MDTPASKGVNTPTPAHPPLAAEQDVANYFRQGPTRPDADAGSKSFLSSLLEWLSPAPAADAPQTTPPPRRSILLVDDDPDGVDALLRMFEKSGYPVRAVTSAHDALAAIATERPGVVLLDIMMPGMDGVDLLKTLRADPANATLPVLMLTANHRRMLESFTSGAQDYLLKPIDFPKVRESVDRQLGKDPRVH